MKVFVYLFFSFFIFLSPLTAQEVNLTIFTLNDVYDIFPRNGYGGLAEFQTLLNKERETTDHYLTTVNGDFLSPSLLSGLFQGSQIVDIFNQMEVDLVVFGNHEFDYGIKTLKERMRESNFCWLGSNVLTWSKGIPFNGAQSSVIFDIEGVSVGIIGLCTTETGLLIGDLGEIIFAPIVLSAQAAVHSLKKAGADIIIALTHLSIEEDIHLAKQVPEINLILGGHDHESISWFNDKTLIHKSGHDAQYLGRIDLKIEKKQTEEKTKTFIYPTWKMIPNHGYAKNLNLKKSIDEYASKIQEELAQEVGLCEMPLDSSNVRRSETSMGNLIADALRENLFAEIGLINSGAIRGNRLYLPGTKLTKRDIQEELPFNNIAVLVEVSGEDLISTIEAGLSKVETSSGGFLQVSGIQFVYDPDGVPGMRVHEMTINSEPVDKKRIYRLATIDYLLKGGDGNLGLKNAKILLGAGIGPLVSSTVVNYLSKRPSIAMNLEGRILDCNIQLDITKINVSGKRVRFK